MAENYLKKRRRFFMLLLFCLFFSFVAINACNNKGKEESTSSYEGITFPTESIKSRSRRPINFFEPKDPVYQPYLTQDECIDVCNRLTEWFGDRSKPLDTTNFDRVYYMIICGDGYVMVNRMPGCSLGAEVISVKNIEDIKKRPLYDENWTETFDVTFCGEKYEYNYGKLDSLDFLSYFPNLLYLRIFYNRLENINALTELRNLEYLMIYACQLSDISALSGLTDCLARLELPYNQISDLSPLAGLKNLEDLDLTYNKISDVGPLAQLDNLFTLKLNQNEISDLSPLSNLTGLCQLYLKNNRISDITPLYSLTEIEEIGLGNTNYDLYSNTISKEQIEALRKALPKTSVRD